MKKLVWLLLVSVSAAQQQEVKRPTSDIDSGGFGCTAQVTRTSPSMPKAYDGAGLSTSASLVAFGDNTNSGKTGRMFKGWTASGNIYSSLTLNVNASFDAADTATGCIKYSTDGGSTYTTIHCSSGTDAQATYSATLSPTLDFTKLRVVACGSGAKGQVKLGNDPGVETLLIWDIWTVGTNPPAPVGTGSTSGVPHRALISVN